MKAVTDLPCCWPSCILQIFITASAQGPRISRYLETQFTFVLYNSWFLITSIDEAVCWLEYMWLQCLFPHYLDASNCINAIHREAELNIETISISRPQYFLGAEERTWITPKNSLIVRLSDLFSQNLCCSFGLNSSIVLKSILKTFTEMKLG